MKANDFLDSPSASSFLDDETSSEPTGAAFGIYPKQRATPSSPETKAAVQKAAETGAAGMEALGFFPPSEQKDFDIGRVPESAAVGGAVGRYAPQALQVVGKGLQYVPYAPVKAAGKGAEVLGRALRRYTTPGERTLGSAAGFAAADVGGQVAEKAGLPSLVGMGAGVKALEKGLPALGKAVIGTTQPEVSQAAKKFEGWGVELEPAQLRKDKPLASPGFREATMEKNENILTKKATEPTGTEKENILPGYKKDYKDLNETQKNNSLFLGDKIEELGKDYDKIFNRKFTIDGKLVNQLKVMRDFELSVNPAGAGEVAKTAENLIRRYNEETINQQQKQIENRIKRIMQTQQRGGVAPITRLKKDWPTIRDSSASNAPSWMGGVENTVKELSDSLGLKVTPKVWVSEPSRDGLYGMATFDGHIIINDKLDIRGAVATALHEFGHQAEFQLFVNAPKEQRQAVIKSFNDQMASIPIGKKTVEQHRPLTAEKYGEKLRTDIPTAKHEMGYLRDFSEWFAEQTSRWITTTAAPTNTVEKFFAKVADSWKKIYQRVVGYIPMTSEVDKFFRANWRGDLISEAASNVGVAKTAAEPAIMEDVTAKIDGRELQILRNNMRRLARTATNGDDRQRAAKLVQTLDEGLGRYDPESLQKLQETNKKYAATMALADGVERGFVTQGKISPRGLGDYLASTSYGYGAGTTMHPLYELGYGGRLLNISSRAQGVDYPGYDAVAAMFGRGKQALAELVGGRTQLARSVQRSLSEQEAKKK